MSDERVNNIRSAVEHCKYQGIYNSQSAHKNPHPSTDGSPIKDIEFLLSEIDQLKKDALELARYVENNAHDEKHCIEAALGFKAKYGEK